MDTLKVFANDDGEFGNPVGVVVDTEQKINSSDRQKIATESGYSEIVFIDNFENGNVSIYTPVHQIPFAGHALVGVAYFLKQKFDYKLPRLFSLNSEIKIWTTEKLTWVNGSLSILPKWNFEQLDSSDKVNGLSLDQTANKLHTFVWAWLDESKGLIRARTFANDWGIPEDEANGSGSMRLASNLNREITVIHGKGSVIHARPSTNNSAEVGGLVWFGDK